MKPAALLVAGLCAGLTCQVQATDFRSTDIHPDGYPTVEAVKYMGTVYSKLTNGKDTIKVFNNSALGAGRQDERTRSVRSDDAREHRAENNLPTTVVPTMPFLSAEGAQRAVSTARSARRS